MQSTVYLYSLHPGLSTQMLRLFVLSCAPRGASGQGQMDYDEFLHEVPHPPAAVQRLRGGPAGKGASHDQ